MRLVEPAQVGHGGVLDIVGPAQNRVAVGVHQVAHGEVRLVGLETGERTTRLEVELVDDRVEVEFNFTGLHHVDNALVALAIYRALGLPLADVAWGAREILFSRWRGEEAPLPGGGVLINDCYNANPVSMRAALTQLGTRAESRRRWDGDW